MSFDLFDSLDMLITESITGGYFRYRENNADYKQMEDRYQDLREMLEEEADREEASNTMLMVRKFLDLHLKLVAHEQLIHYFQGFYDCIWLLRRMGRLKTQ